MKFKNYNYFCLNLNFMSFLGRGDKFLKNNLPLKSRILNGLGKKYKKNAKFLKIVVDFIS